ncbi:MAG TPA: ABC-2 family transporter protein [Jatrophihabitantaceae bacterium]
MAESPYAALLRSRMRTQTSYRASFIADLLAQILVGFVEFSEVYIVFANVRLLGGLTFVQCALVFALANVAFSLGDLAIGHVDQLPIYLRQGTLDAMLLRPLPVLAQLATGDVSLRRLGRTAMAVGVLCVVLPNAHIAWTPMKVILLTIAPIAGAAVFAALFVAAAAMQFWLVDGGELASSFTYGGSYVAEFPTSVLHVALRVAFTFVVPAGFVAYFPTLILLGQDGPAGWPSWLGWGTPVMALLAWSTALLWWRAGLHHYTGAGG